MERRIQSRRGTARSLHKLVASGSAWLLIALVSAGAAESSKPTPATGRDSAILQYVETLPTSSGGVPAPSEYTDTVPTSGGGVPTGGGGGSTGGTGAGSTNAQLKNLPPALATALRQISSSSRYGAPTTRLSTDDAGVQQLEPSSTGSFLSSAASAVGTASHDRLFGLGIAMLVIAATAVGMASRLPRGRPGAYRDRG